MKRIISVLILATCLSSCGEGIVPNQCLLGGDVEHEVTDGQGWYSFNEYLEEYTISYHVPGTIDSFLTGVICQTIAGTIDFPETGEVVFSGQFLDDNDRFDPNVRTGGEEFFYLNLTGIQSEKKDTGK